MRRRDGEKREKKEDREAKRLLALNVYVCNNKQILISRIQ